LLSWERITYLEQWPPEYGSPFSKGRWQNIKSFFYNAFSKGHVEWEFPDKLPKEPTHGDCFIGCREVWRWICGSL